VSTAQLSFAGGTLLLAGVPREPAAAALEPSRWAWDRRVGAWRADAIEYPAVLGRLRTLGFEVEAGPSYCQEYGMVRGINIACGSS